MSAVDSARWVERLRADFPALARRHNGHPVAYFDGPGGTQVPSCVPAAITDYLLNHNGNNHWAFPSSQETDAIVLAAAGLLAGVAAPLPRLAGRFSLTLYLDQPGGTVAGTVTLTPVAMAGGRTATGRYQAPPNLPAIWPMPAGVYDPGEGTRVYQGMVERIALADAASLARRLSARLDELTAPDIAPNRPARPTPTEPEAESPSTTPTADRIVERRGAEQAGPRPAARIPVGLRADTAEEAVRLAFQALEAAP